jgi:RNA polymerase sigma factor (sigma-70 family)
MNGKLAFGATSRLPADFVMNPSTNSRTSTGSFPATRSSLLSRARNPSDGESWSAFHAQYQRLVMHVCLKSGLGRQDAEDVAQEAMAAVAKALPTFELDRGKGGFRGWLYTITTRKVMDFLRKKYREGAVMAPMPEHLQNGMEAPETLLKDAWEGEWRNYVLERALERIQDKVSARDFQIFHLSAVKLWTVDQIRENLCLGRTVVYLARYRVGNLVKKEIAKLSLEME